MIGAAVAGVVLLLVPFEAGALVVLVVIARPEIVRQN